MYITKIPCCSRTGQFHGLADVFFYIYESWLLSLMCWIEVVSRDFHGFINIGIIHVWYANHVFEAITPGIPFTNMD